MKSVLAVAGTLVLACIFTAAHARPVPAADGVAEPVSTALLATISKALVKADVPTLDKLYRNPPDPATHVLAAMALERIHFNLDQSSADARICERALIDSQPRVALYCAQFANGNLRLAEGRSVANAAEADIVRRFAGRVPEAALQGMRNWVAAHPAQPPLRVSMPRTTFTIPMDTYVKRGLGSVKASANGVDTWLAVDTGSSLITVDADTAHALGARMQTGTTHISGFISRRIPERLGLVPHLRIADVRIDNAAVRVLPGHVHLLGIDVLRQFGAFRLSRHAITVYPDRASRPACQQPLLVATDLWGNSMHLVAALPIDGSLRTTLLDSGTSHFLSASAAATGYLHPIENTRIRLHDMGARAHHPRVSRATTRVLISGRPFEVTATVFKDARLPWDFILGSGALGDMDLYVDFDDRHTCLLLHDNLH